MLYELLNQDSTEQVFHPSIQDSPIRKFHYDPPGEKYSRKVFVGGLPPDIDESKCLLFPLCVAGCFLALARLAYMPSPALLLACFSGLKTFAFASKSQLNIRVLSSVLHGSTV